MKNISIVPTGHGHFKITTDYRGKKYSAITTNTMAIDRYRSDDPVTRNQFYNSAGQAANALYREIKAANYLY